MACPIAGIQPGVSEDGCGWQSSALTTNVQTQSTGLLPDQVSVFPSGKGGLVSEKGKGRLHNPLKGRAIYSLVAPTALCT